MIKNLVKTFLIIFALIAAILANSAFAGEVKSTESKSSTVNANEDPDLKLSIEELKKKYPIDWLKEKYGDYNNDFCQENFGPDDVMLHWPCGSACSLYNDAQKCPKSCYGKDSPKNLVCRFLQDYIRPEFKVFSIVEYKSAFSHYGEDSRIEDVIVVALSYFLSNDTSELTIAEAALKKFIWSKFISQNLENGKGCKIIQSKIRIFYKLDANLCRNSHN